MRSIRGAAAASSTCRSSCKSLRQRALPDDDESRPLRRGGSRSLWVAVKIRPRGGRRGAAAPCGSENRTDVRRAAGFCPRNDGRTASTSQRSAGRSFRRRRPATLARASASQAASRTRIARKCGAPQASTRRNKHALAWQPAAAPRRRAASRVRSLQAPPLGCGPIPDRAQYSRLRPEEKIAPQALAVRRRPMRLNSKSRPQARCRPAAVGERPQNRTRLRASHTVRRIDPASSDLRKRRPLPLVEALPLRAVVRLFVVLAADTQDHSQRHGREEGRGAAARNERQRLPRLGDEVHRHHDVQ